MSQKSKPGIDYLPDGTLPKNVSISTEKALFQYNSDSPQIFHTTLQELWSSKEQVANKLADPLKKAIPIILVLGLLMGFVVLMSNIPPIIDVIAKYTNVKPPIQQVEIVYLTPDEARARGIAVPEEPTAEPPPAPPENPRVQEEQSPSILDIEREKSEEIEEINRQSKQEGIELPPGIPFVTPTIPPPEEVIPPQTTPPPETTPEQTEPETPPQPEEEQAETNPEQEESGEGFNKPKLLPE